MHSEQGEAGGKKITTSDGCEEKRDWNLLWLLNRAIQIRLPLSDGLVGRVVFQHLYEVINQSPCSSSNPHYLQIRSVDNIYSIKMFLS
jgi:hypothetical protein